MTAPPLKWVGAIVGGARAASSTFGAPERHFSGTKTNERSAPLPGPDPSYDLIMTPSRLPAAVSGVQRTARNPAAMQSQPAKPAAAMKP
jgi:hypothetical protein